MGKAYFWSSYTSETREKIHKSIIQVTISVQSVIFLHVKNPRDLARVFQHHVDKLRSTNFDFKVDLPIFSHEKRSHFTFFSSKYQCGK